MDHFELVSEYEPTGDQPQAIEKLTKGFQDGNQFETLLGVTGSGKTFTMANVIQQLNKATVYKGLQAIKRNKWFDRVEKVSDFPLYFYIVAGCAD